MPREQDPSNNEREFLLSALREGLRLDSRALDAYRDISLTFGDEYGVADVRLGKTRVMARISAEVTAPYPDRKFDGIFTIATEMSPMASPAFEVGRQDTPDLLLSRQLEKSLRRSGALDTESLCIVAGAKVFHIRADLHVLDHDGNLTDACCLALVAALLHFRRPDVEVHGEEVKVYSLAEREPVKLGLHHWPFCVSASLFEGGEMVVWDARLVEEQCREGGVVVCANRFGEVCSVAKLGGVGVAGSGMLRLVQEGIGKVKMLDGIVKQALEADEKKRDKGGLMKELRAENER